MADRYWVGGTAAWDGTAGTKWALTSGGAGGQTEPTAADDVFFNAASGANTVTISGTRVAKSITCTGFTGTLAGTATPALTLSGNLTLATGMTVTYTGTTTFNATSTITSNGKTLGPVTVNGSGITVTLGDALNIGGNSLTITQGTFTTSASNYSVTAANLLSSNTNTRTITLNGSTVTLAGGFNTLDFLTSTNLTFNAGTSTINCTNPNVYFYGGGQTFNNVSIGDSQNNGHLMTGANTFNNLTIVNRGGNGTNRLSLADNQTVTGTFACNSTNTLAQRRYWIYSDVAGTNRTITAAAINIFGTDFRNITGAGAASWSDSSRTRYWGDAGGNSGITFATGRNVYWNLAGSRFWYDTGWALTNNGAPAAANYPLIQDTAIFTEAGAAGTITLDTQGFMIGNLTMADGVSNRTSAMTLNFGAYDRDNFFGNITFFSNLTITTAGYYNRVLRLSGYNNTQSMTSAGKTLPLGFEIAEGHNNTVKLEDALTLQSDRMTILTNGTLNLNNNTLSTGFFDSSNSNTRAIQFGTSNITITGSGTYSTGSTRIWNTTTSTNLTYTGTPTVNISNNSATASIVESGGTEANAFDFNFTTGTYSLTFSGVSRSINFTGFSGTLVNSNRTIYGSVTLSTGMTLTAGSTQTWAATSGTKTITSNGKTWDTNHTFNGVGGTWQLVDDLTSGNTRTLTVTNGTFNANGFNVSTGLFSSSNSNTRTITMGSGTWTLSGTGTVWNLATTTGLTFNKDTANIVLSDTSTTARTFVGGGLTYNNLTVGGATGTSTLTIEGANTFATLASTKTVAHTIVFPNATTTVSNWTIKGTAGNVVTLTRTGASGTFTLAKSGGGVVSGLNFLSISNSTASPSNTWYTGIYSTNGGGNTNWIFGAAPAGNTQLKEVLGNINSNNVGDIVLNTNSTSDWLPSDGTVLSQATYPALYSQIGLIADNNGTTWITRTSGTVNDINALTYGNGRYLYVNDTLRYSTDGITWTSSGSDASGLNAATYGNGLYVIGGNGTLASIAGGLATSTNAITWTARVSNTLLDIYVLTYGNGTYIYGGQAGLIATSTNGTTWTVRTSGTSSNILALTYGNGTYVYGGVGGVLRTSTDGTTWTARTSGTTSTINVLTYGNGLYLYGGFGGVLATSTDAITWDTRISGTTSLIDGLIYGNGTYVYVGDGGVVGTSADAIIWASRTSGTSSNINTLTYGNGTYIYGGAGGVLATSSLYSYNSATDFVLPNGSQSLTKDVTTINYIKPR